MTQPDRLSIEEVETISNTITYISSDPNVVINNFYDGQHIKLAKQLANTMRENERMKDALEDIALLVSEPPEKRVLLFLCNEALSSKDSDNG